MTLVVVVLPNLIDSFKNSSDRQLLTFNEMIFLQISYYFVIFNIVSSESNFIMGYVPIGILSVFIGGMMLSIFISSLKDTFKRIRFYFVKRSYLKGRVLF